MIPSADHIAAAIVAACKETGARPEDVAMGVMARLRQDGSIPHARAYAALALRAIFEDAPTPMIARAVGYGRQSNGALAQIDFQFRNGRMKWWDDAAFMRVVEAVEAAAGPVSKDKPVFTGTAVSRQPVLKASPIIRVRRRLGALVEIDGLGDRPAGRPRAEQFKDERDVSR